MSIEINALSNINPLQQLQKNTSSGHNKGVQKQNDSFGGAFELNLSKEAKELLQNIASATKLGADSNHKQDQNNLLEDIFGGVSETLDFANEEGLGEGDLKNAAEKFHTKASEILKEANGKPLNDDQVDRLLNADESFHSVADEAFGADHSQSQENPVNGTDEQLPLINSVSQSPFTPYQLKQMREGVQSIIQKNDDNGDKQLSFKEAEKAGIRDKSVLAQIDKNNDGQLSSQEFEIAIKQAVSQSSESTELSGAEEGGSEGGEGGESGGSPNILSGANKKKQQALAIKSKIALLEAQARSKKSQAKQATGQQVGQYLAEAQRLEAQAKGLKSK